MRKTNRKLYVCLDGVRGKRLRAILSAGLAAALALSAQAPDLPPVSFDVASIKPHPGPITVATGPMVRGSSLVGTAITLLDLIADAYGLRYDQVAGAPGWVPSDHFDIAAKAAGEGALPNDRAMRMLQALLADRFQLVVHRETKDTPVYALVVGKNGPKLKGSDPEAPGGGSVRASDKGMHMEATKGTMEQLARQLSFTAGRPVIDRTGLTGRYAFALDWLPANRVPPPDSDTPSLFVAVQEQLGLKLEPVQAPVEMLIVDRAERPSGN